MNQQFKKRLNDIIRQLEDISLELDSVKTDFQEWMDGHDGNWEYTRAGETAQEELDSLEYIDIESLIEEIQEVWEH